MENYLIVTWNMQGAGNDPHALYSLLLDKMQEKAKLYRPEYKICLLQECGSPETLMSSMQKNERSKMFLEEISSVDDGEHILKHYVLNANYRSDDKRYDFYAVWRSGDAAKRCGTGILLLESTTPNKPVILNSFIDTETAGEEEDVADEVVVGDDEVGSGAPVIKQIKHPRPILALNVNGVWVCTMHAIANRNAAKKQLPQCIHIVKNNLQGEFVFGGDFNCERTELIDLIKRMSDENDYVAACKSVGIYGCGLKTQGASVNRKSELDYFITSKNYTALPPASKISVCETVDYSKEVYSYSDHDMVCACFAI